MDKDTFDYVAKRVDILIDSDASTSVTKAAARTWKDAVAADMSDENVKIATDDLLNTLSGRPTPIDGVIAFLEGPALEIIGKEAAASSLTMQKKRKEEGAKYCDCEACTAALEILSKFGRVELC